MRTRQFIFTMVGIGLEMATKNPCTAYPLGPEFRLQASGFKNQTGVNKAIRVKLVYKWMKFFRDIRNN